MGAHKSTKDVVNRLSRIEGHIRGIKRMVEEEKPCEDVLIQFSAVQAALAKASKILLQDHFEHCIMENVKDKETESQLVSFKNALDSFLK